MTLFHYKRNITQKPDWVKNSSPRSSESLLKICDSSVKLGGGSSSVDGEQWRHAAAQIVAARVSRGLQMDVSLCGAKAQSYLCASHRTMLQNDSAMLQS